MRDATYRIELPESGLRLQVLWHGLELMDLQSSECRLSKQKLSVHLRSRTALEKLELEF